MVASLCPDFIGQMMTKIGARGDVSEKSIDLIKRSANMLKEVMGDFPRLPNCDPSLLCCNFLVLKCIFYNLFGQLLLQCYYQKKVITNMLKIFNGKSGLNIIFLCLFRFVSEMN